MEVQKSVFNVVNPDMVRRTIVREKVKKRICVNVAGQPCRFAGRLAAGEKCGNAVMK